MLVRLQAINALPDGMLRTAYVFIREYCSKAEVSLRELRIILKNAGKIADEKLKALVDWVRGKPEYYNKIEAEGLELLREEEAELADKGLLDKVDELLEEKSGKLAEEETLSGEDVESAIEKAKNTAERDSHPCKKIEETDSYTDYENFFGKIVRIMKQSMSSIEKKVARDLKSTDIGKQMEAKVADYIMKNTDVTITNYSSDVISPGGKTLRDIDVATETQWIEVKTSVREVDPNQIKKYAVFSDQKYINVNNKEVILYIDEPLGELTKQQVDALKEVEEMGVTIVNGLEELGKVVK